MNARGAGTLSPRSSSGFSAQAASFSSRPFRQHDREEDRRFPRPSVLYCIVPIAAFADAASSELASCVGPCSCSPGLQHIKLEPFRKNKSV